MDAVIWFGLILAALPAIMTVVNLLSLTAPRPAKSRPAVAILIPARDEERTIAACVEAALGSVDADVRVVVGDDGSTDRTPEVVRSIAAQDRRVSLAAIPPLPPGLNGKQHACHVLSGEVDQPFLLFVDADVRLAPDAAARLAGRLEDGRFALVSGVPRQVMEGFWERLLIPMINALMLGYLPMPAMRRSGRTMFGAACGQMIMVRRDAYLASGGHGAIAASMHDGLKLPRTFRSAGFMTDLVDGALIAECRMYDDGAKLRAGFSKNATEGMATPTALPVWTVLLIGGHVLPWLTLPVALLAGSAGTTAAAAAAACALPIAARTFQSWRCREPFGAVVLHPAAVATMVVLQWRALIDHRRGKGASWRGRRYETGF